MTFPSFCCSWNIFHLSDTKNRISVDTYFCLGPLDHEIILISPRLVMQIPGTLLSEFLQTVHYQLQSNVEYTPNILKFCVLADFRFFDSESRSKMIGGFHRQSQNHTPYQYPKEASTPLLSSSQWAHPHPADTFSVPAITDGYARTTWPKHFHPETYVGLPVHWAISLLREGTTGQWQSRQRPRSQVKLVSTLDRAGARQGLGCITTPSRPSCPGWAAVHYTCISTVFTSLACYLGAFQDRWGLSSPHHVATTFPCGQPGLPCV